MTKTFRPLFSPPEAALLEEEALLDVAPAAGLDDDPVAAEELDELEEQAASATVTGMARASHVARLIFIY
jgi:2-hydroxychromene-2-carboxylate isomerase